jgi:hypothetical protein
MNKEDILDGWNYNTKYPHNTRTIYIILKRKPRVRLGYNNYKFDGKDIDFRIVLNPNWKEVYIANKDILAWKYHENPHIDAVNVIENREKMPDHPGLSLFEHIKNKGVRI